MMEQLSMERKMAIGVVACAVTVAALFLLLPTSVATGLTVLLVLSLGSYISRLQEEKESGESWRR